MKARNYWHEYAMFQSKSWQKKDRAARNRARRESGLKVGDDREVDHIHPLAAGGSNEKSNRRVVSRHTNRVKGKR